MQACSSPIEILVKYCFILFRDESISIICKFFTTWPSRQQPKDVLRSPRWLIGSSYSLMENDQINCLYINSAWFSFAVRPLPESSIKRTLRIQELLDTICAISMVSNSPESKSKNSQNEAEIALRQLRLVSKAFFHAASSFFSIEIESIDSRSYYGGRTELSREQICERIAAMGHTCTRQLRQYRRRCLGHC